MTNSGRDPRREARRAGDGGDFVLGADGKILRDRYGRPVRRRPSARNEQARRVQQSSRQQQDPQRTRTLRPGSASATGSRANETRYLPPRQTPPEKGTASRQRPPRRDRDRDRVRATADAPPQQYKPTQQPPAPQPRLASSYWEEANVGRETTRKAHSRRKRANPLKRFFGCFGWIIALLVILALVLGIWSDSRLTRTDALPPGGKSGPGTNWLLVGSDSRQGLSEEDMERLGTGGDMGVGRTDTIMVLHIPRAGKAQLVSIPRDSYVNVPGFGEDKINAAFTYGGPQLLAQTVEETTGLHMDHYAEIGMGGLANLVDAVGGVKLCPDEPIDDPLASLSVEAGCQKFDGPTALGYVRTRATAQGDLDRVQRQREFFSTLLHKVTSPATLINPARVISLISKTTGFFTVDNSDHVWHLAHVALAMAGGVDTETVPVGGFLDTEVGSVVLWDDEAAQQLFDSMR